jgi:acetyl-CoA synthetase
MVKITDEYKIKYQESIDNPEKFWQKELSRLDWLKLPTKIKNTNFQGNVSIKWFEDGELNPCYNLIDRHVINGHGDDIAIIWEGNDPNDSKSITYSKLLEEVSNFANILEDHQVKKGDNVIIYMPMIPEAAYAMLACTRIGAVHSVVFGGFSARALSDRIIDCDPKIIITVDETRRGDKFLPLKNNVAEAFSILNTKINTLVVDHHVI